MTEGKLIEEAEDIRLKDNQDLLQILGKPPGWFLRWGITVVFFAVAMLLAASWIIKFPDVIPAQLILTTEHPPVRVFTRTGGKISQLLVENAELVEEGQILAIMENPANRTDVDLLEQFLTSIKGKEMSQIHYRSIPLNLDLGSLQNFYAAFTKRFDEYHYLLNENTNAKKVRAIRKQIRNLVSLNRSLGKQRKTLEKVLALTQIDFNRTEKLKNENAVSEKDVENAETRVLQQKRELETLSSQVFNNNIQIEELNLRKMELKRGDKEGIILKELSLEEDIARLNSEVKAWKQRFIITAPIAGKVSMSKVWSAQQFLNMNAEIMAVVPEDSAGGSIIGKAVLPLQGSGKVEEGMDVNIRLNGYPYQEFGSVEAKIKSISLVPEEGQFLVELDVPDVLNTTYNKTIPFRQQMGGIANIITEDRRILERIFEKILSILKNR